MHLLKYANEYLPLNVDGLHSFIHSGIYIAPLQGNYSEALPTPTRPKITVLSLVRKVSSRLPGCRCSSRGRPFQIIGPATEKARFCIVAVRAKGTIKTPFSAERRRRRPGTTEIKQQRLPHSLSTDLFFYFF